MTQPPPRRAPRAFPIDDAPVYTAYIAGRQSAALAVAVRVGLFDRLDAAEDASEAEIGAWFGWSERGTRSMVAALSAMGLLERRGDRVALSAVAAAYAVRDRAGSLWALIDMEVENFLSPAALMTALERDDSSVYGGGDPWEAHEADPEKARAFTRAMHSVSERPAAGFAEVVEFPAGSHVLDVGGGSGALSIAIARAWPDARCTIFDLASVCAVAHEYVAAAGVADRVDTMVGDMFGESLPEGHDAILFSQILHDWSFDTGRTLLAAAFAALPPGGRVLIHEKLVDDDADTPLVNALVHLDMLVWTRGQQYRFRELREMLEAVGFAAVERRPTAGVWSVVIATRPDDGGRG